jgi:surface protein
MRNMFFKAKLFNQDISKWNVSKVTNMKNIFFDTKSFTKDISNCLD